MSFCRDVMIAKIQAMSLKGPKAKVAMQRMISTMDDGEKNTLRGVEVKFDAEGTAHVMPKKS